MSTTEPTPKEIAEMTAEIRADLTPEQLEKKLVGGGAEPAGTREVRDPSEP